MKYEDALAFVGRSVVWADSGSAADSGGEGTGGTGRLIDVTISHAVIEAFDGHIAKRPARVIVPLDSTMIGALP
jgi:hypothetical protein